MAARGCGSWHCRRRRRRCSRALWPRLGWRCPSRCGPSSRAYPTQRGLAKDGALASTLFWPRGCIEPKKFWETAKRLLPHSCWLNTAKAIAPYIKLAKVVISLPHKIATRTFGILEGLGLAHTAKEPPRGGPRQLSNSQSKLSSNTGHIGDRAVIGPSAKPHAPSAKFDQSLNVCALLLIDLCGNRFHAPSDQAMHEGKRFGRSIQDRVGCWDGPHAQCMCRAKSVGSRDRARGSGEAAFLSMTCRSRARLHFSGISMHFMWRYGDRLTPIVPSLCAGSSGHMRSLYLPQRMSRL